MFNNLSSLGYGIITFAIIIGVGVIVLSKTAESVAGCATGYAYNTNGTSTFTDNACCLTGGTDCSSAGNYTAASSGTTNLEYMNTQMGTTGLAGWTPAIIALSVGMLFLGVFMARNGDRI